MAQPRGANREEAMWRIGPDPGGRKIFGWCVVEASVQLPLVVRNAGVANHASSAVDATLKAVKGSGRPTAGTRCRRSRVLEPLRGSGVRRPKRGRPG